MRDSALDLPLRNSLVCDANVKVWRPCVLWVSARRGSVRGACVGARVMWYMLVGRRLCCGVFACMDGGVRISAAAPGECRGPWCLCVRAYGRVARRVGGAQVSRRTFSRAVPVDANVGARARDETPGMRTLRLTAAALRFAHPPTARAQSVSLALALWPLRTVVCALNQ